MSAPMTWVAAKLWRDPKTWPTVSLIDPQDIFPAGRPQPQPSAVAAAVCARRGHVWYETIPPDRGWRRCALGHGSCRCLASDETHRCARCWTTEPRTALTPEATRDGD